MKCCETCETPIDTRDGENRCKACEKQAKDKASKARRKASRAAMREAMQACGLVRVRGAMGGVYYE